MARCQCGNNQPHMVPAGCLTGAISEGFPWGSLRDSFDAGVYGGKGSLGSTSCVEYVDDTPHEDVIVLADAWVSWARVHLALIEQARHESQYPSAGLDPAIVRARVDINRREKRLLALRWARLREACERSEKLGHVEDARECRASVAYVEAEVNVRGWLNGNTP